MKQKLTSIVMAATLALNLTSCAIRVPEKKIEERLPQTAWEAYEVERDQWQRDLTDVVESTVCIRTTIPFDEEEVIMVHGTGFVYTKKDGWTYLATNAHVVEDGVKFEIVDSGRDNNPLDNIELELVRVVDDPYDTAVLRTKENLHVSTAYKIEPGLKSEIGDKIFIIGFPLTAGKCAAEGIISNIDAPTGNMILDVTVNPGNSGGMVFYKSNEGKLYLIGQLGACLYQPPVCVGYALIRSVNRLLPIWDLEGEQMELK